MSEVEQVERQIEKLSAADLAKFRAWFFEFDARVWDAQIESDLKAGKLQGLIAEALAARSGKLLAWDCGSSGMLKKR
ncbi:MAG: hypothetical protein L0387_23590 [Acidobacteria bacterium]|nr:hypothetical protein [Acidobacteriota bacterium]MCI0722829.1 hypothetical protein [Acidobacteriota bacterium]